MTLYYIWIQTVNDLANQSCASEASLRVNTLQMKRSCIQIQLVCLGPKQRVF